MNWGRTIGLVMSALCVASAIGYAAVKDWRHTIYFVLAAGINLVTVW
jgi:hypothetical protein